MISFFNSSLLHGCTLCWSTSVNNVVWKIRFICHATFHLLLYLNCKYGSVLMVATILLTRNDWSMPVVDSVAYLPLIIGYQANVLVYLCFPIYASGEMLPTSGFFVRGLLLQVTMVLSGLVCLIILNRSSQLCGSEEQAVHSTISIDHQIQHLLK